MRLTIENGEPHSPNKDFSVHKIVEDQKRFTKPRNTTPHQDVYREDICQSFIDYRHSKMLKKSTAKLREKKRRTSADKATLMGMKRKHGGGLFGRSVAHKPYHIIDSF